MCARATLPFTLLNYLFHIAICSCPHHAFECHLMRLMAYGSPSCFRHLTNNVSHKYWLSTWSRNETSVSRNISNSKKTLSTLTGGPSNMKMNLVGTGTSVKSPIMQAWLSRMKADKVLSRKSTSPTRMLLASAPCGILRIKCVLPCGKDAVT